MAPEWFLVNILFEFVAPENDIIILIILSRVELPVNLPSLRWFPPEEARRSLSYTQQ